tara:strand:- start:2820 stop:3041 length:222 start_codon:yes stop_codon:yes gene_type:complete
MPIKTAKIDVEQLQEEVEEMNRKMIEEFAPSRAEKIQRLTIELVEDGYVILKYLAVGVFFYGLISLLQDVNII